MEPFVLRKRLFRRSLAAGLVAIALLAVWIAVRHVEAVRHRGGGTVTNGKRGAMGQ